MDLLLTDGGRFVLGIAGGPGVGKSTFAAEVVGALGLRAVGSPLDGFHLADVQLGRQGLLQRKGAPETFDAWGYAALLARLREPADHVVYAPGFERDLEQPLTGAVAVPPEAEVVVTEARHVASGKTPDEAARWVATVDEPNAALIEASAVRADLQIGLTDWAP